MRKIEYLFFSSSALPGVSQKVSHTVSCLRDIGYLADARPVEGGFFLKRLRLLRYLLTGGADITVVRYEYLTAMFFLPVFLLIRLKGRRIIFDVPTPLVVAGHEIVGSRDLLAIKIAKLFLLYVQGPFVLCSANLVLQYGPESSYFSIFLKKKIKYVSNGIDCKKYQNFRARPKLRGHVRFVCVGTLAPWHGVDRLINGIYEYCRLHHDGIKVSLAVIGGGEDFDRLVELVKEQGLQEYITFYGWLEGEQLLDKYRDADIGVGALALHKKGLTSASPLKNREYCALGLPMLYAHKDPDFEVADFCMVLPSDDSHVDVCRVLDWYFGLEKNGCSAESIKLYAQNNLDYRSKWKMILKGLQ